MREVIERFEDIDASPAELVGVFPSSKENIKKHITRFAPRFRVVSDPEEKLYAKYKAETSWAAELRTAINIPKVVKALATAPNNPFAADATFNRVPCEVLIHQGSIAHAYYGKTLDDGESIDTMLQKAAAL